MKGLLIEKGKGYYLVLTPTGEYRRTKGKTKASIGQQVKTYSPSSYIKAAALAAALLIFVTLSVSELVMMHSRVYAYITVDARHGAEFAVDRENRVLSAKAYDPEAENILCGMEYSGVGIEKVLTDFTVAALKSGGDTDEGKDNVVVSYYSPGKIAGESQDGELYRITRQQRETIKASGHEVDVETVVVDKETRRKAEKQGISPGRLKSMEKDSKDKAGEPDNKGKGGRSGEKGGKGNNDNNRDKDNSRNNGSKGNSGFNDDKGSKSNNNNINNGKTGNVKSNSSNGSNEDKRSNDNSGGRQRGASEKDTDKDGHGGKVDIRQDRRQHKEYKQWKKELRQQEKENIKQEEQQDRKYDKQSKQREKYNIKLYKIKEYEHKKHMRGGVSNET